MLNAQGLRMTFESSTLAQHQLKVSFQRSMWGIKSKILRKVLRRAPLYDIYFINQFVRAY